MDRSWGRGWCLLVLVTETMSMRRGVPDGLRMPPAAAHDPDFLPREFADARYLRPRPRIPCPEGCGRELQLVWGDQVGPYVRHVPNASIRVNCTAGGEGDLHKWAKEDLADYLSDTTMLHFASRCKSCDAKVNLGSVPVKKRIVKTEYQLPNGGRADIAVCVGNETKVVIEVLSTNPTSTARPEPWYEVEAKAVLRVLKLNQSSGELECVRPDGPDRGVCRKCERLQQVRDTRLEKQGNWTARFGKHKGKTFKETSLDITYGNNWLGELVHEEYWQIAEQLDPDLQLGYANSGPKIAFELPKGDYVELSSIFRNKLKLSSIYRNNYTNSSLLAFVEYLVNDPDLYAIEVTGVDYGTNSCGERSTSTSAKRERTPYKPGTKRAAGVTLLRFDSQLGKWTNTTTHPRLDVDDGYY